MSFDVFISYSSKDAAIANAACAALEAEKIRCWIAPRDILPSEEWGGSIVRAIDRCRVMVLIFSADANRSRQVLREINRAFSKGVAVVPLRIENVTLSEDLAYYLDTVHWLDALTPPLERGLQQLTSTIRALLTASEPVPSRDKMVLDDAEAERAAHEVCVEDKRRAEVEAHRREQALKALRGFPARQETIGLAQGSVWKNRNALLVVAVATVLAVGASIFPTISPQLKLALSGKWCGRENNDRVKEVLYITQKDEELSGYSRFEDAFGREKGGNSILSGSVGERGTISFSLDREGPVGVAPRYSFDGTVDAKTIQGRFDSGPQTFYTRC